MASAVTDIGELRSQTRPRASLGERLRRAVRGRPADPSWVRPALLAVAATTLLLLVWGLGRNGYANTYYSAAVLAGTKSWKAFFFGSLDAGNFITVDKPAMSLWPMEISARIFGLSSWSILLPEALIGVAAVVLLFSTVRRVLGHTAGLIAAALLALTPVAVAIFRYNNPDAQLTLLLVAAAYALLRALETDRTRWLLLSAVAMGLAFNTKYLEADILLPALTVTYLVAARGGILRRLGQMLATAGVLLVSSAWWLVIVDLIPASSRPWVGSSPTNSVLDLVLNYDGFGRLTGQGAGAGPARFGGGFGGFGGGTGLLRIFNNELGGQIAWLVPLALVGLGAGLWARRRAPRIDLVRAGYLLFGVWMITEALVFDYTSGILHSYYTVAMAPPVAALVAGGAVELWRMRARSAFAGPVLGASVAGTALLADRLLARTPSFVGWLGTAVLVAGVVAGVALAVPAGVRGLRLLRPAIIGLAAVAVLAGPVAYSIDTVWASTASPMVAAGPAVPGAHGGFPGRGAGRFPGAGGRGAPGSPGGTGFAPHAGSFGGTGATGGGRLTRPAGFGRGGTRGGTADRALVGYLEKHRGDATWIVATSSAMQADGIELASGDPVLAMGGFSGNDPAMTVSHLQSLVASGQLRYVLASGTGGGRGGSASTRSVMSWVASHGTVVTDGGSSGATLYDLSGAVSGR
jgi:4-amino-4-deoxy-L-arabinose transferase-like glycosyltransferase